MSFAGDLTGIVGTAVLGAVAIKSIEVVGNVAGNVANPKKKKKSKAKNDVFSMDMPFDSYDKPKKSGSKKMKKSDNIFDMGNF